MITQSCNRTRNEQMKDAPTEERKKGNMDDENEWDSIWDIAAIPHTQDLHNEQGTWAHHVIEHMMYMFEHVLGITRIEVPP